MKEKLKQQVVEALMLVLRPIVKILLRHGIGVSEFSEMVKKSYVDVASAEYGIRGRPTNISRVAVMSGLTRKEVRRLRNSIEKGDANLSVKTTPIAEILHRWCAEDDFLDENGRPAVLSFSDGENSFSDLVKRFGGDVPAGAMRTELKRIGSVGEDENGCLRMLKRSVSPSNQTNNLISSLAHSAYPLLSTIVENCANESGPAGLAQLAAYSTAIRTGDLKRLRRISYDRLDNLAESFDDLFMAYETLHESAEKGESTIVSVGLFYFEERDENAKYNW